MTTPQVRSAARPVPSASPAPPASGPPAPARPATGVPGRLPFADPAVAADHFAARLALHTDVSDVHAALEGGAGGFVLVDSRSAGSWDQGHIPGAVHLPTARIADRARDLLDPAVPVVVHCWGPGCDGAAKAALALARLGYRVKEMIGGIEYWIREGFPVRTPRGAERRAPDPLTAPAAASCGC